MIRRRKANALIAASLAGAMALAVPASAAPARQSPAKPNIVVLLADDWGFTDVGSFGSEIATPNIDALARRGVRFSNFHAAAFCAPTRAMLQTGISNHRAGLGNMPETIPPEHVGRPGYEMVLNNRVTTIADRLRGAGYRTYFTGKWHLGRLPAQLPHARGYDRAFALADAGADNFEQKPIGFLYLEADWTENGRPARLPANYYSSTFLVDKAIEYIDSGARTRKPFFASINFLANHIPVQARDADIARYANSYTGGWSALRTARRNRAVQLGIVPANTPMVTMASTEDWAKLPAAERTAAARAMAAYGGMAEAMDREVGRLVAHLRATGQYDNTVFVFLSDNGAEPSNPQLRLQNRLVLRLFYDLDPAQAGRPGSITAIGPSWASAASSPLAGYKGSASEGGLRVPLIVAWPGNTAIKGGRIANGFAHVTDIAPTLLALAGVGPGTGGANMEVMRGANLTPMLTGAAATARPVDQPLGYELSGNAALFRGPLKLVKNLPPTGDGRWRLFDIVADPGETRDLSAAMPEMFATMQEDYRAYAERDGVLPMPAGYTAEQQMTTNAFRNSALPQLRRAAPVLIPGLLLVLAVPIGGVIWWRRRRRALRNSKPSAA